MKEQELVVCFPKLYQGKVNGEQFFNHYTGEWEEHGLEILQA